MSPRYAPFTIATIVVCWAVFVAELAGGDAMTASLLSKGALVPALAAQGQWWRFITSGFLHANLMHIGFNTYALYQAGVFVEFAYGSARFAAIYTVALIAGSLAAYLSTIGTYTATLGASGAIMGIFGAMAMLGFKLPALRQALLQSAILPIVLTLGYGFTHPNVSNAAHIGGLLGGGLCALMLAPARRNALRAG